MFHKLFDTHTLDLLESVNELLDCFSSCNKSFFPIFDCNGRLKISKTKIKAKDVKNMTVGRLNDFDHDYTLKELLDEIKREEKQ